MFPNQWGAQFYPTTQTANPAWQGAREREREKNEIEGGADTHISLHIGMHIYTDIVMREE